MKVLKSVLSWGLAMTLTGAALVAAYSYFQLPGLVIVIALGAASALRQLRGILSVVLQYEDERAERRFELQWFDEDYGKIHFPSMLMLYRSMDDYYLRLYALRRAADGTWHHRLTSRSHEAEVKEMRPVEEWWDRQRAMPEWKPIEDPRIEVAYQRFVHAQDVAIVGEKTGKTQTELWLEEVEKYVESQAKAGDWARKWTEYRERFTAEEFERRHA
jgi:hypothetical protein